MIQASAHQPASAAAGEQGFTFVEILVAATLLAVSMLAMCSVFVVGFSNVSTAGKSTVGTAAAHQMLEDIRTLPFDSIAAMDGFDTDSSASQPASDPARELARRWRYALAGDGVGWSFTTAEKTRWTALAPTGIQIKGTGTIDVVAQSATLSKITVSVAVPGRWRPIVLTTLVAKL